MRILPLLVLIGLFPFMLPSAAQGEEDPLRSFSFSLAGMARPSSIHIWQEDNGQILLKVRGSKNYRTSADKALLRSFSTLVQKHDVASWADFEDRRPLFGSQVRDGERFGLSVQWGSGKQLNIHGTWRRPQGFQAFQSDVKKLWGEAIRRFPWQPPTEIRSEDLASFSFIERTSPDENRWLMLTARKIPPHVSIMICRGSTVASNRSYSKADSRFLETLNDLVRQHNLVLWHDRDKALEYEKHAGKQDIPYVSIDLAYNPASRQGKDDDMGEERINIIFSPEKQKNYRLVRERIVTLFEHAEK